METLQIAFQVAQLVGIASSAIPAYYATFKKSNVETYFKEILKSGQDLSVIGDQEKLQRYFLSSIDKVANEANKEKIKKWKNAIIHLATDFNDYSFTDNFLKALEDLTVYDLTVLYSIYSSNFTKEEIDRLSLEEHFKTIGLEIDEGFQSVNRLVSYNFLHQKHKNSATFGRTLEDFYFFKNNLGRNFIKFISDVK